MNLKLITPPTALPLHINDVRQHIKQDITDDDNLISLYISSAVEFAQAKTNRQFVAARYQLILDAFPAPNMMLATFGRNKSTTDYVIQLFKTPLIQVVSIDYTASDGTTKTMAATDYIVDSAYDPPRIMSGYGKEWPITQDRIGAVKVTFDTGYMAPIAVDIVANTVTIKNWKTLIVGDNIRLSNSGGVLPAPLANRTDYYIQSVVSPGVYTLTTSPGGSVLDLTVLDSGISFLGQPGINGSPGELPGGIKAWMLLRSESLYTNRGETVNTRGNIVPLPFADSLLDPYKMVLM